MNSHIDPEFRKCLAKLSREKKQAAIDAYKQWKQDPFAGSLRFKCVDQKSNIWSVRIGIHYRAFGARDDDEIIWFWIGSHEEANNLIKNVGKRAR